jgi:uncharacterized protein (TIGR03000 family)
MLRIRLLWLTVVAAALSLAGTGSAAPAHHSSHGGGNWHGHSGSSWHGGGSHSYYHPHYYGHSYYGHGYWPYRSYYSYGYSPYTYFYSYPYTYAYPYTYYYNYPSTTYIVPTSEALPAKVRVHVTPDAIVSFNDQVTSQQGEFRTFETPALSKDQDYTVNIRVRWAEGDTTIERSRSVDLHAGDSVTIDFMAGKGVTPDLVPEGQ